MTRARNAKNAPVMSVVTSAYAANASLDGAFESLLLANRSRRSASRPEGDAPPANAARIGERRSRAAARAVPAPGARARQRDQRRHGGGLHVQVRETSDVSATVRPEADRGARSASLRVVGEVHALGVGDALELGGGGERKRDERRAVRRRRVEPGEVPFPPRGVAVVAPLAVFPNQPRGPRLAEPLLQRGVERAAEAVHEHDAAERGEAPRVPLQLLVAQHARGSRRVHRAFCVQADDEKRAQP